MYVPLIICNFLLKSGFVLERTHVRYAKQSERKSCHDDEKCENITAFQYECQIWPIDKGNRAIRCHILMPRMQLIQNGSNKPSNFTLRPITDKNVRLALQVVISKKARLGDVKNQVPPKTFQCSTIWCPISLKPTFSNSTLSCASIDVSWSHFDNSKPYFAIFFKRVIFFEQPCMSVSCCYHVLICRYHISMCRHHVGIRQYHGGMRIY